MSFLYAFIIGIILGWALYRSKFCFANFYLQSFYLKDKRGFEKLIFVILASSIAIGFVQLIMKLQGLALPELNWNVGLPTLIGAFLFGIGMTLAGSCTGTALVRIGEGTKIYILVTFGIFIGYTIGNSHYHNWWDNAIILFDKPLWGYMPWTLAIFGQLAFLFIIFLLLKRGKGNENC